MGRKSIDDVTMRYEFRASNVPANYATSFSEASLAYIRTSQKKEKSL